MLKILGNLRSHKKVVALIIALLIVQAVCDLALPNYTKDLIDVGIQNKGIEYAVPEDITADGYKAINLLLTDGEQAQWHDAYRKNADGTYSLKADADREALDAVFTQPVAIYYMVSQADTSAFTKGASFNSASFDLSGIDMPALIKERKLSAEDFSRLTGAVVPAVRWDTVSKQYALEKDDVLNLIGKLKPSVLENLSADSLSGLVDLSKIDPSAIMRLIGLDSKNPDIAALLKKLDLTDDDIRAAVELLKPALNSGEIESAFGLSPETVGLLLDNIDTKTLAGLPALFSGKTDIASLIDFSKIDMKALMDAAGVSADFSALSSGLTAAQRAKLLEAVLPALDREALSAQTGIPVSVIDTVLDKTDPAVLAGLMDSSGTSALSADALKDCIDYDKINYPVLFEVLSANSSGFDMTAVLGNSSLTQEQKTTLIKAVLPAVDWDKVGEKTGIPPFLLKMAVYAAGPEVLARFMAGGSGTGMNPADFTDCIDYSKIDYTALMSVIGTDMPAMDFSAMFSGGDLSREDRAKLIGAVLPAVNAEKLSRKTGIPAEVISSVLTGVDAETLVNLMDGGLDPAALSGSVDYAKIDFLSLMEALGGSRDPAALLSMLGGMSDAQLKAAVSAVLPAVDWQAVQAKTGFRRETVTGLLNAVTADTLKKLSRLQAGGPDSSAFSKLIDTSKLDTAALGKILNIDLGALLAGSSITDGELRQSLASLISAVDWETAAEKFGFGRADVTPLIEKMTLDGAVNLLHTFGGSGQTQLTNLIDTDKVDFKAVLSALHIDTSGIQALIGSLPESLLPVIRNAIFPVREQMNAKLSTLGDSIIHSSAVAFVAAEYARLGKDVNAIQTAYLWTVGLKMLAITLLSAVAVVGVGYLASITGAGIGRDLREKVFNRVIRFSSHDIDQYSTASLITRSTNDIQQVQFVTGMMLRLMFYAPILSLGGIIMVARTGANMWWIVAAAIGVILSVVAALVAVTMPKFKMMQTLIDKVNLISREILGGLPVIRAFGREKEEEDRFEKSNKNLTKTMLFTNRMMSLMMPLLMLAMFTLAVSIVWISAKNIDRGSLQVGAMTAFLTYAIMIVMGFLMLTILSIMVPRASVAANRIDEVIKTAPSVQDPENPETIDVKKGVVRFEHVAFAYPGAEENTLSDIDFTAAPGQITAVVGSTGCGKSTLVNLIPRFYDVTAGAVTVDGKDVRKLTQRDLRDMIGYVPQKGVLFSGTVAYNLRFGAPDASDGEIRAAAQIAQAADFIEEKEGGYDSEIAQEGSNVSGGQKQRLSIARAIAKKPKIYIFDDSFSALDFKTDLALRKALAPIVTDATVIIVAQRISTVMHADQIVVLDEGAVAGIGTHRQLMENCEVYRQIAQSQLSARELEQM